MNKIMRSVAPVAIGLVTAVALNTAFAADEAKDPKRAKLTYFGTGEAEHLPEFGEATFTFTVDCLNSPAEVVAAIEKVSGPIWAAIAKKIPPSAYTDTNQPKWGDIQNVLPRRRGRIEAQAPVVSRDDEGKVVVSEQYKRQVDTCSANNSIFAIGVDLGWVFGGTQTFAVSASDLDWLESLVNQVQKQESGKGKTAVTVGASLAPYSKNSLTAATVESMDKEMRSKAQAQATGDGSRFALDRDTLKFKSYRQTGSRLSFAEPTTPTVGSPFTRGTAPQVTLELPITYKIYAETKSNDGVTGPAPTEYKITGRARMDADYATTSALVFAQCQPTRAAALETVKPYIDQIVAKFFEVHGGADVPMTETDSVTNYENTQPTKHWPYQPVSWDQRDPRLVKEYFNSCTGQVVAAPATQEISDLPSYWEIRRQVSLKSKKFDALADAVDTLQAWNTQQALAAHLSITVNPGMGAVLPSKTNALWLKARREANACLLKPSGLLANEARLAPFSCAHVKDIIVGRPHNPLADEAPGGSTLGSRAPMRAMMASAPPSEAMNVEVITKPGELRPRIRLSATYEFTYDVLTENYVPGFASQPQPAPLP